MCHYCLDDLLDHHGGCACSLAIFVNMTRFILAEVLVEPHLYSLVAVEPDHLVVDFDIANPLEDRLIPHKTGIHNRDSFLHLKVTHL